MIALDFDNTIVCHDDAFREAARRLSLPTGEGGGMDKARIKAVAMARGGNDLWTRLQGIAYSEGIVIARPFEGAQSFFQRAGELGVPLVILSHKTEFPALGPRVSLREAAEAWLLRHGFTGRRGVTVEFCDTRAAKVARLAGLGANTLLDDLPEVFHEPGFPAGTRFVLFDPGSVHAGWSASPRVTSWMDAAALLLGDAR